MSQQIRLPRLHTTFIGRGVQVGELVNLMKKTRLLTCTGPAGSGKTRLALEAAWALAAGFEEGVYWCDLSSLSDASYLPQSLAAILESGEQPALSALDAVIGSIGERNLLVVLDNCEHLLDACAGLVSSILGSCEDCSVLATSLQPLGLPEEMVFQVPPLAIPEISAPTEDLAESESVRLFVTRASEAFPGFALTAKNGPVIASICRRLDGLPLAIELAAARVKLLTVEQIEERLDRAISLLAHGKPDPSARHQTLRAALDWAFQFLNQDEQLLLRRLSVFSGPFTLGMAESVCASVAGTEDGRSIGDRMETLDVLTGLAEKSFILLLPRDGETEATYRLLEVIRQYAREELERSGEAAATRHRYLDWCLAWAEESVRHLEGAEQGKWLSKFERMQEHFRASLRWASTSRRVEEGLRLSIALTRFWLKGSMEEGRTWLEELLNLDAGQRLSGGTRVSERTLAYALAMSGRLGVRQGDDAHGVLRGEASLTIFRALGDQAGLLVALNLLALAAADTGDYSRATGMYEEALGISRQSGEARMTGVLLNNLGLMYYERQEYNRAAPLWEQVYVIAERNGFEAPLDNLGCLAMMKGDLDGADELLQRQWQAATESDNKYDLAVIAMDLGELARRKGDLTRARNLLESALSWNRAMNYQVRIGENLVYLGHTARNLGEFQAAQKLYESSLPYLQKTNYTRFLSQAQTALGTLEVMQGRDEAALPFLYEGLRIAESQSHRLCAVEAVEEIAAVWARGGQGRDAARLILYAAAERERVGGVVAPVELPRYEQLIADLEGMLERENSRLIRSEARARGFEQVVKEVLDRAPRPVSKHAGDAASPINSHPSGPQLSIYALGPTRVTLGSRALTGRDWKYVKAKELLYYLVLNPPASKSQIGLDLWPDASSEQLRRNLHQTMYHLRRALGDAGWIQYLEDAYAFAHGRGYWCDALELEEHLRAAGSMGVPEGLSPQGRARAIEHLEAGVRLWRGDLLQDLDAGEWALIRREAMRQSYLRSLLDLGQLLILEARYRDAAATFERALTLDNYLEAAHRGLMRALARQGDAAAALRHFKELRALMRNELAAEPSPETMMLNDRLRRGDDV